MTFDDTGLEKVIVTRLDLKYGAIIGAVRRLAAASKYEVKTPNGVASIRCWTYYISATLLTVVAEGFEESSVAVSYVKSDGTLMTWVITSGQAFDPAIPAVRDLSPEEIKEYFYPPSPPYMLPPLPPSPEIIIHVSPIVGSSQ